MINAGSAILFIVFLIFGHLLFLRS
jgi:hypothetical protein